MRVRKAISKAVLPGDAVYHAKGRRLIGANRLLLKLERKAMGIAANWFIIWAGGNVEVGIRGPIFCHCSAIIFSE